MADTTILEELRPDSGKRLPTYIVQGFTVRMPRNLGIQLTTAGGKQTARRTSAPGRAESVRAHDRLCSLGPERSDHFAASLNDALSGSSDYPVLNALLGTAAGFGTGGAGLLFTIATTALSATDTSARVLSRAGDEIWRVEEVGKITRGGRAQPTYVVSYFLFDPNRTHAAQKGWLLHEDRYDISE